MKLSLFKKFLILSAGFIVLCAVLSYYQEPSATIPEIARIPASRCIKDKTPLLQENCGQESAVASGFYEREASPLSLKDPVSESASAQTSRLFPSSAADKVGLLQETPSAPNSSDLPSFADNKINNLISVASSGETKESSSTNTASLYGVGFPNESQEERPSSSLLSAQNAASPEDIRSVLDGIQKDIDMINAQAPAEEEPESALSKGISPAADSSGFIFASEVLLSESDLIFLAEEGLIDGNVLNQYKSLDALK